MRVVNLSLCFFLVTVGLAHAQGYQITYTGKSLHKYKSEPPVSGATHEVMVFGVDAIYANQCHTYYSNEQYPLSTSDGANTSASLTAAGYVPSGAGLYICTNAKGTKLTRWSAYASYTLTISAQESYQYSISTYYASSSADFDDVMFIDRVVGQNDKIIGEVRSKRDQAGKWTIQAAAQR